MIEILKLTVLLTMLTFNQAANADGIDQQKYVLNCAGCHGVDGSGSEENGIPDMRNVIGHYLRTPEGRAYLVQVPGVSNSALSNKDIVLVLTWMIPKFSEKEMPKDAKPYTEEEVNRYRVSVPADIPALKRSVISNLRQMGYEM